MKIQFCGGAQTVTGSQFLLTINGSTILAECGIYQGKRELAYERNQNFIFDPKTVDAVILTHAHMDHSGNLPNLVKKGFNKKIYATSPTVDLCKIMLRDAGHLQEKDIEWVNKIRAKQHKEPLQPYYTVADAEACMDNFMPVEYEKTFTVAPGVDVRLHEAGHILGSAGILLDINEKGRHMRFGITGDVGRANMPILKDPNLLRELDGLIIESTYGNRLHGEYHDVEEEFVQAIRETVSSGGKVIIPAFAVGRTQHLVYILHKLYNENRIPDVPIFVDSPLASHATDVFRQHPECFDRETNRTFVAIGQDPFSFPRLTYTKDATESKNLNTLKYPCIIISGSGMCEGGRILHHLRNNIEDHKVLLLFVGYAAKDTLARKIMDGAEVVKIFGEEHKVKCKIKSVDSFSAHADRRGLLDYISITPPSKLKNIFLVHGELEQSTPLKDALRSQGYENIHIPNIGETINI